MRNTNVIAINPKHQAKVNKAVQWEVKYELANDQRNIVEDNLYTEDQESDKVWRKWNKQCEKAYDKYLEYMEELPKGEQKNIEKKLQY